MYWSDWWLVSELDSNLTIGETENIQSGYGTIYITLSNKIVTYYHQGCYNGNKVKIESNLNKDGIRQNIENTNMFPFK